MSGGATHASGGILEPVSADATLEVRLMQKARHWRPFFDEFQTVANAMFLGAGGYAALVDKRDFGFVAWRAERTRGRCSHGDVSQTGTVCC
jgi:hypothetical protein